MKTALHASVSLLVLSMPFGVGQAFAAEMTAQAQDADEKIIVTATKREAGIQDVAIAVTAVSQDQLEKAGVQDISALGTLSPSFNLNTSQTESQGAVIRLRGVGTTGNNVGLESSVGVFVDGVYLSRPGIALGDLLDVQQIEILRGPQGTLFGRNTSAGALTISTRRPDLNEVEHWANATLGNYSTIVLQGGTNAPVIDNELAVRVAGSMRERDGYLESSTGARSGSRDRFQLRGQALWEPTDRLSVRVIADYSESEEECCDAVIRFETPLVGAGAFAAAGLPANGGAAISGQGALDDRRSNSEEFSNDTEQYGLSTEVNWDNDLGTLTYVGSYRKFDASYRTPSDFVSLDVFAAPGDTGEFSDEITTHSHEIRFQGRKGPVDWLVGGFFYQEDIEEKARLQLGEDYDEYISATAWFGGIFAFPGVGGLAGAPLATGGTFGDVLASANPAQTFAGGIDASGSFASNLFTQDTTSFSVFTHNNITLTDKLEIVLGARYTNESKDGVFEQLAASSDACLAAATNAAGLPAGTDTIQAFAVGFACFPFAAVADVPGTESFLPNTFDRTFDEQQVTGTFSTIYRLTELVNVYFTYSRGFKSGGFNLDSTAAIGGADPSFDSELINLYEGGLKGDFLDGLVRANLAVFHQGLKNFQVLEFTGVQFTTFNVDRAASTGFELELSSQPIDGLFLDGGVTYADARYPDDCDGGDPNAPTSVSNLCGNRLTNSSRWGAAISALYQKPIPETGIEGFVAGNLRYESQRRTSTQATDASTGAPLKGDIQEGNAKVNLRVGLTGNDGLWGVELFANNVFDKQTQNTTFNVALRGTGSLGTQARGSFIEEPRLYGLTLRFRR